MEGVEFKVSLKATKQFVPFEDRRYPQPLQQRIQQGEQFRRSGEELTRTLKNIEEEFTKEGNAHTASPDCETCVAKRKRIWQAYSSYYLGVEPGRWDADLPEYRKKITEMFAAPEKYNLEDIDTRSKAELREHLRKDLCATDPDIDSKCSHTYKMFRSQLAKKFAKNVPTEDILKWAAAFEQSAPEPLRSKETSRFLDLLHAANTPQDKAQAYRQYYCSPSTDETAQQKNMKGKYRNLFDSNTSPESVVAAWKAEALQLQLEHTTKLTEQLRALKLAQSAQERKQAAKQAVENQKLHNAVEKRTARCSMQECGSEVDLDAEDGVLECALCDWLASKPGVKGEKREHAYYCCETHVEDDFGDHDLYEHACSMDLNCIYDGRRTEADTRDGGICQDCLKTGFLSYFCSKECWDTNMSLHRDEFHHGRNIDNQSKELEMFEVVPGLIISPTSPLEAW
ncbi:hypothetical protein BJ878DRAFT_517043 [Calycina marina]|uniref:Uncharacterized protein n=1 Tax=Calycina marina TaxID=1763456 RepID=A0A9P7YY52_9HELO|nr:hypothetical protein BJ878DRAFT_517043 [Calycina marina]